MSKMMRVTDETANDLNELAKDMKKSKQLLMEMAVKKMAREQFFRKVEEAYRRMSPEERALEIKEAGEWDVTLADGLAGEGDY